ncbi:MAG: SPOR domain-containing protein [Pseudomonadales bacterium]
MKFLCFGLLLLLLSSVRAEGNSTGYSSTEIRATDLTSRYTIQMGAFKDESAARSLASSSGLDLDQMGVARIASKGNIFFVLAYGLYTSADEAEQAAQEVCAKAGLDNCWVRNLEKMKELAAKAGSMP